MQNFTRSEVAVYYAARIPTLTQNGREWRCPCPVHGGQDLNFTVDAETGMCYCHSQCGKGWDIIGLEMELSAKEFQKAKAAVYEAVGRPKPSWEERDVQATYDYTDATGALLYQVVRKVGKKFMQRRKGPKGKWIWNLDKVALVPFNLPAVMKAEFVAITEGEKDAINLTREGVVGTCNNGGAGNFKPELAPYFKGKEVAIFPDNDEPGRKHAKAVAQILAPFAKQIRIVEIPGLAAKGDISDFLLTGGNIETLMKFYENATEWSPTWDFISDVPHENDQWVRTPSQYVHESGGMARFWSPPIAEGSPTPWQKLNTRLGGGMRAGEVYVIGANQGQGKTSLALQFALHAVKHRKGVLFFSMEMSWRDVFQRMASIEARVDLSTFREMQKNPNETASYEDMRMKLERYTWELMEYPLYVSTKTRVTPDFLLKESQRLNRGRRISLVVVDHMQLMGTTGQVRGDYEKFTAISRATKETAMELGVPVLLVSQTSRNNSHDKRLELEVSDLRGSGAIEEDAAAVMLLYDDKEDRTQTKATHTYDIGPVKTWLKLGKNRYGAQECYMPLLHFKRWTRFEYQESITG
jgi:KaiC/GvpD/RAD55 family RecA-like ATPase